MPLDDLAHDGEPGAGAAAELVAAVQPLEDPEYGVEVTLLDADSVVAHVERGLGRRITAKGPWRVHDANLDPAVRLVVVLDGVGDQVCEHLAEPYAIRPDDRQPPWNAHFDVLLAQADGEPIDDIIHHLLDVHLVQREISPPQPRV